MPKRSLTQDEMLDDITLYWLTNTGTSAAQLYWENNNNNFRRAAEQRTAEISVPVAITVFPGENLSGPGDMGAARVSEADLLPRGRQRRSLRRVGATAALRGGAPGRVQVVALSAGRPERKVVHAGARRRSEDPHRLDRASVESIRVLRLTAQDRGHRVTRRVHRHIRLTHLLRNIQ